MLERRADSAWAKAAFFERYNDVDVYVEDSSKETKKLYSSLLSRALQGRVRIECVFPLGRRESVVEACRADQAAGDRRRVYIIDADLDLCQGKEALKLDRLYRLPRYCIENFLIDGHAAATVLARESEDKDAEMITAELSFEDWLARNSGPLRRLFVAYGAANGLAPSFRSVGLGYTSLLSDDSGVVDPLKVEDAILGLKQRVDEVGGEGAFDCAFRSVERAHAMKSDRDFVLHFVSGKDYLLPLLRLRMNKVVRFAKSFGLLKTNLAGEAAISELRDVESFMR